MSRYRIIIGNGVKNFHPAYFAMVMATGIVSIAFEAMDFLAIARALFMLNLVFYTGLSIVLVARIAFFRRDLIADLKSLQRAWLFLTFVVGTNTVGMQLLVFQQAAGLAALLWLVALLGWFVCIYSITTNLLSARGKPVHEIVNGATLLIAVGTVSVALLGIRLLETIATPPDYAYFTVGAFWSLGFILYLLIVSSVTYCLLFRRFESADWDAPYWICMGAAAIVTLAGADFVTHLPAFAGWKNERETMLRLTELAWLIGTLWIPYQVIMDIRKFTRIGIAGPAPMWIKVFPWSRLALGRQCHVYDPPAWSRVFPMGMYTACTLALTKVTGYEPLAIIPYCWGWFALLIWGLTLVGTLRSLVSTFSSPLNPIGSDGPSGLKGG